MSIRSEKRFLNGRTAEDYTIIVAYDGERTEEAYFRGWEQTIPKDRLFFTPIFVKSGGNALSAVEQALKKKKKSGPHAEFWCVCDVDDTSTQDLNEAISLSQSNDIRLCLSNRCFELWIALHYNLHSAPISCEKDAISLIQGLGHPKYGSPYKEVPFYKLLALTNTAIANGEALDKLGHANPNTKVYHLARKLLQNCL